MNFDIFFMTDKINLNGYVTIFITSIKRSTALPAKNVHARLSVRKYKTAARIDKTVIYTRWRPCPAVNPTVNNASATTTQNSESAAHVTTTEFARRRTTRRMS